MLSTYTGVSPTLAELSISSFLINVIGLFCSLATTSRIPVFFSPGTEMFHFLKKARIPCIQVTILNSNIN